MRLTVNSRNFVRCLSALALLAAGVALMPSTAAAQCVGPAGNAGDTMFNSSYGSMQTCNGTSWKAWHKYNADGWKKISPGVFHTCGIKMDDTLWCWGQNNFGQLGDGTLTNRTTPTQVSGGGQWLDVSARGAEWTNDPNGYAGTCAIKMGGAIFCWGSNRYEGLGRAGYSAGDANVPTVVSFGGTWKAISGGYYTSCAIRTDDRLFCWGNDLYGQLGDGAGNTTGYTAREVSGGGTWKMIAMDPLFNAHICAIKSDDTAWCWGIGSNGRLGNGAGGDRFVPTAVSTTGVTTWKYITAGSGHSCGIKTDDTGWCWGDNSVGELGDNTIVAKNTPVQINTANGASWKVLTAGSQTVCGIRTDDSAWCWGYGQEGNIGNGVLADSRVPLAVTGGHSWKTISTDWTVCGLRANDTLWCWAENFYGGVGNGTTTQVNLPTHIGGGSSACTSPAGNAGDMFFNQTSRVLQWCDGAIWVGAGPSVAGVPGGCSGPTGTAGDIMFNSTSSVSQYCDGDLWRSTIAPCSGPSGGLAFTPLAGQAPGTIVSDIVQVTGLECPTVQASISGTGTPSFRVCADATCTSVLRAYSNAATTVSNGQYIQARFTAANMPGSSYTANVALGAGVSSFTASVLDWKFIFITSVISPTQGNLGGLAGADAWCNSLASAASLPGTYMAWLSTSAADAPNVRFNTAHGLPYRQPDAARTVVAASWAALTSGTLSNRVSATQTGGSSSGSNNVFTNVTTAGGNKSTTNHCSGWTSTSGTAQVGSNNSATATWTDSTTSACNSGFAGNVYCVQQ